MSHISGISRSQLLLLPEAVDDYVGLGNPVQFIEAFVGGLDIADLSFQRAQPKSTGRPGYEGKELKLRRRSLVRTNVKLDYCDVKACAGYLKLSKCTKGTYRTVMRYEADAVLEQVAKRLRENPEILTERRNTVEHPFNVNVRCVL